MLPLTWDIVVQGIGEVGKLIFFVAVAVISLEVVAYLILVKWLKFKNALPFMLMLPALAGVAILILYPFGFNIYLAFSNMSMYRFKEFSVGWQYGISNLLDVFACSFKSRRRQLHLEAISLNPEIVAFFS